jgi:hypothetical protein
MIRLDVQHNRKFIRVLFYPRDARYVRRNPSIDPTIFSNGIVSDKPMYPERPKPVPGTASMPASASIAKLT